MRNKWMVMVLAAALSLATLAPRAAAEDKGIIALQQAVSLLMQQVGDLQKALTTQSAVMQSLINSNTDTINKLSSTLAAIQQSISGNQVIATQQASDIGKQFQALADTLSDIQTHLQKMDDTLVKVQQMQQTLPPAPVPSTAGGATGAVTDPNAVANGIPPAPGTSGATTPAAPANPALALYQNALTDFQNGSAKAQGELSSFIRLYPNDPMVPSALYYMGSIFQQNQQYNEAIDSFSKVIEQYPDSDKAPIAELNKGICLSKRGDKQDAISELRAVSKNYPGTEAAQQADIELKALSHGRG